MQIVPMPEATDDEIADAVAEAWKDSFNDDLSLALQPYFLAFDESKVTRDDQGQFAEQGGGGGTATLDKPKPTAASGVAAPARVFHGTTAVFEPKDIKMGEDEDTMMDRMIGAHFAEDPEVANKFTGKFNDGAQLDGGNVLPIKLAIKNAKVIDQKYYVDPKQNAYLANLTKTDQQAIAEDILSEVMPEHKEIFVDWMQNLRAVDKEQAGRAFDLLKAGKSLPKDEWGVNAFDAKDEYYQKQYAPGTNPIGMFMGNYDSQLMGIKDFKIKQKLVAEYREKLKAQGYDGIRYENTSPNETKGVKNKTAWIAFDRSQIKSSLSLALALRVYFDEFALTLAFDESKVNRDDQGQFAEQGGRKETLEANLIEAEAASAEVYTRKKAIEVAFGKSQSDEDRQAYNKIWGELSPLNQKVREIKDELQIHQLLTPSKVQAELTIAPGVDIDKSTAQLLLDNSFKQPWGDESPWAAARYKYTLTGRRDGYGVNDVYKFTMEAKNPVGEKPDNTIDAIPHNENSVYRGMSREEWDASVKSGQLQSLGNHNMDQDGYTFYGKASTGTSYAGGFAPVVFSPAPGVAGVVVEIPRKFVKSHADDPDKIPETEFAHKGTVPLSEVTNVWELPVVGTAPGNAEVVWYNGQARSMNMFPPRMPYAITKMKRV